MSSTSAPASSHSDMNAAAIIRHHLRQHIDAATSFVGKTASPPIFHLSVLGATVTSGVVTSNGKGMLIGPLKSASGAERDRVAAQFPELAPGLRGRLDSMEADLVILISRVDINGRSYSAVTGVGVRDFIDDFVAGPKPVTPLSTE